MNEGADQANPYQPPSAYRAADVSGNPLMIPGIVLLVLSGLMLALILLSIPRHVSRMLTIDTATSEGQGELLGMIVPLVMWVVMMCAVIWGSTAMLRLRGYRDAMAAAVLSVIPVCSPCFVLGIPFGIWAITLLLRPDVRARFQG